MNEMHIAPVTTDKKTHRLLSLVLCTAMLIAVGLSVALKPQGRTSTQLPKLDLEAVIPMVLDDWKIDQSLAVIEPPADVRAGLEKIYSQTLSRTYINPSGSRVMLSIAYGDGFDKQLDVHRPEYCYGAQGFEVSSWTDIVFKSQLGDLPLRQLVARQRGRVEPISYWITLGDTTVSSTLGRKFLKIPRMFTGQTDSGMLVRVSSIDPDTSNAYAVHETFINAFLKNIAVKDRNLIVRIEAPR